MSTIVTGRGRSGARRAFHFFFWLIVTVVFLYDRRYLIQKFNLPEHFIECVAVRLLLIMSLVYLHLYYLVPRFFRARKYLRYSLLLLSALFVYVSLQNLYDIYLYGFVIGDVRSRDFWHAFPYNFISTSWYLVLTAALKMSLDRFGEARRTPAEGEGGQEAPPSNGTDKAIFLKSGSSLVRTSLDAVTHIKGLKDYSIVFTTGDQIIVKGSLKTAKKLFPGKTFIRVHKSYLVALDLIQTISDNHILIGEHHIPIGRTYKKELYKTLAI